MTSQAQAESPLPGVAGLAFLGWPLHPAGKPSVERAAHLSATRIPMLFIQGTRDALGDPDLMREVVERLGSRATLVEVPEGDHSFHVPTRSGRTDHEVLDQALARASIASRTPATLWLGRLSQITVSPTRSVGASICST